MTMWQKLFVAIPVAVLAVGGSTACATKKFVRQNVGEVNTKVDSLGRSIEETQERTRKNEGRIGEVDQKAQAAQTSATQAGQAAATADGKAVQAGEAARMASARVEEVNAALDKATKRIT